MTASPPTDLSGRQFSLAMLLKFVTVCAALLAFHAWIGVLPAVLLAGMSAMLQLRHGIAAMAALALAIMVAPCVAPPPDAFIPTLGVIGLGLALAVLENVTRRVWQPSPAMRHAQIPTSQIQ